MFENSLGEINAPTYFYWEDHEAYDASTYIIIIILTLFISLIFMMKIVLLNFLIAVISQTYEDVMSRKLMTTILQKAEMNRECRLILNNLGLERKIPPFILQTEKYVGLGSDSWQGFVVTINNHIKEHAQYTNDRLARVYGQLDRKLNDKVGSLNTKVSDLDNKVSNFRRDITYMVNDLLRR